MSLPDLTEPTRLLALPLEALREDAVRALYARLLDELTVWWLWRETPEDVRERHGRPGAPARRKSGLPRAWARKAVRGHLTHGPLSVGELADLVYGRTEEPGERTRRHLACCGVLKAMLVAGLVVRVGHGWYALPDKRDGMRHLGKADCVRFLGRAQEGRGWTTRELAARFDVTTSTIHTWLKRAAAAGYDVRRHSLKRPDGHYDYRYRIAPPQEPAGEKSA